MSDTRCLPPGKIPWLNWIKSRRMSVATSLLATILAGQIGLAQEPPSAANPSDIYVQEDREIVEQQSPPPVLQHYHHHPIEADEPERNSDSLSLTVPRHV